MYKINEIFYSLQGEGANTGTPAVFIRFAGCNLHCSFCDTQHECKQEMSVEDIVNAVEEFPSNFIVLTGGEPGLQVDKKLVEALHAKDYVLAIETNGTCPLPADLDWVTCSPKEGSNIYLEEADEVKVVYTGQDVEKYISMIDAESYYLQPCSCQNTEEVINYCLSHPHWSLSLQTHKLLNIQ